MTSYADWAGACLAVGADRILPGPVARRHYLGWISDRPGIKREPIGKARASILALDPSISRKGRSTADTVYLGVGLDIPDEEEASVILAALAALRDGGMISTRQIRRVAAARLGQ